MLKFFLFFVLFPGKILTFGPFKQNDYVVISERIEIARYIEEYIVAQSKNFKFNRTYTASNWTVSYNKNFGYDLRISVQAYRFASNEYRLFPMSFAVSLCDTFDNNDFGVQNIFVCGNATLCPIIKGIYTICNWGPDYTKFPPHIPIGRYRIDLTFVYKMKEILTAEWYMEIKHVTDSLYDSRRRKYRK